MTLGVLAEAAEAAASVAMAVAARCAVSGGEGHQADASATVERPAAASPAIARLTYLGSMLFSRGVSGARVVHPASTGEIDGHAFAGFGAHCDAYPVPYLTVAAAVGMTAGDVDALVLKLEATLDEFLRQGRRRTEGVVGAGGVDGEGDRGAGGGEELGAGEHAFAFAAAAAAGREGEGEDY